MFSFLHSTLIRTLNNKKSASTSLLNAFEIKNDLNFLCVYFGSEAIILDAFLERVGLIEIHQNILGVTLTT